MATKTKIYLALIAAGLVVLVVDRVFFGASAPASVSASEVDPASDDDEAPKKHAPRSRPVAKQVASSKLGVPELHFPRNLPSYDPAIEMRDIFARADSDDSISNPDDTEKRGSAKKGTLENGIGHDAFQAAHRIDAVMVQESLKIAVVNGRWMRVGDTVDTCTLTKIEGDSAVFQCHDGVTVLSPSGKRTRPPG